MIKRAILWVAVLACAACSDADLEARVAVLTDSLARVSADRDSLSAVLRRLEETPDYYLGRARAARADGAFEEALRLVEQLVVRFPDSDHARAARRLPPDPRHAGRSVPPLGACRDRGGIRALMRPRCRG